MEWNSDETGVLIDFIWCLNWLFMLLVEETVMKNKNLRQIFLCKFLVQDDLHKFLVQVSWACVTGITLILFGTLKTLICIKSDCQK